LVPATAWRIPKSSACCGLTAGALSRFVRGRGTRARYWLGCEGGFRTPDHRLMSPGSTIRRRVPTYAAIWSHPPSTLPGMPVCGRVRPPLGDQLGERRGWNRVIGRLIALSPGWQRHRHGALRWTIHAASSPAETIQPDAPDRPVAMVSPRNSSLLRMWSFSLRSGDEGLHQTVHLPRHLRMNASRPFVALGVDIHTGANAAAHSRRNARPISRSMAERCAFAPVGARHAGQSAGSAQTPLCARRCPLFAAVSTSVEWRAALWAQRAQGVRLAH